MPDFRIALASVLDVLARHLYATPDVFVRELLQNAHDAIVKRHGDPRRGAVRLHVDARAHTLAVVDDGAGLTEREIHDYLATVGASDKHDVDRAIGRFGIGFLSALVPAAHVEVLTRRAGHDAVRFTADVSGAYEVHRAERRRVGTTVTLHLRREHARYLDAATLTALVRRYADFLPVPVYLGRATSPLNAVRSPWAGTLGAARQDALRAFWEARHPDVPALALLGVDERFAYDDDGATRHGVVRGVLAIAPGQLPGITAVPSVDLHVGGMYVGSGVRALLPEWGHFLRGVVECDALRPNAARDGAMATPALDAVRDALGTAVARWLAWMAREEPTRLKEVLRWHGFQILAMAVRPEQEAFFRTVAGHVPLATSRGPLTLRECLRATQRDATPMPLHYVARADALEQAMLLHADAPVIVDASEAFVERFLLRCAQTWPERVRLVRADVRAADAFPVPPRRIAARLAPLLRLLGDGAPIRVRASRFTPTDVPMLLVADAAAEALRDLEDLADNLTAPRYLRDVARAFLARSPSPMVLHVNADNATVRRLAAACRRGHPAAARALLHTALLAGARPRSAADLRSLCADCAGIVDYALGARGEL